MDDIDIRFCSFVVSDPILDLSIPLIAEKNIIGVHLHEEFICR
jgi:hypothetical protein